MRTGGGSINWHPDSVRFFNQELVVSRTYAGKSTISTGKKFDIIPRDGSTAVHRLFTIHSSPKSEYYSRVTAIAHLVK